MGTEVARRSPKAIPMPGSLPVRALFSEVLPGQHDLHQGVMGQASGGVEPLD